MSFHQITPAERYTLTLLLRQAPKLSCAAIARIMGRHRSTIGREIKRNVCRDGSYRLKRAQELANSRRSHSRRRSHFTEDDWKLIHDLLAADLSPEQISGFLHRTSRLKISHETIYLHIWRDKRYGGELYRFLRQRVRYRKRYGPNERRGRLLGKRHISERPAVIEDRRQFGHWEMDTVMGSGDKHCVVTLTERVTNAVLIIKLTARTVAEVNRKIIRLIQENPRLYRTITVDNGTEFHGYEEIERATGVTFYFATPYHSWERGSNENANGLIRQYLPKRTSMAGVSQARCNEIARRLNHRPRKRLGFATPIEILRTRCRKAGIALFD